MQDGAVYRLQEAEDKQRQPKAIVRLLPVIRVAYVCEQAASL